jgi:3-deoxy-D-manno-octulosonate 8-phosphate phosphatase (KDO 8-P phosphatase)
MGDDLPDLEVMKRVGLAAAPQDAAPEIKAISHYVSPLNGGHGCVRDLIEQTLKVQQRWMNGNHHW